MQIHSLITPLSIKPAARLVLLAAAVAIFGACSASPAASENTDTTSRVQPETLQSLVEALEGRGASVERKNEVEQPFFSVNGTMLSIDGEDVQIFEYESEAVRRGESSAISADGRTIGTQSVHWIGNPRFWAQGRILVLYLGEDEEVIGHLSSLLGSPIAHPGGEAH